MTTLDRLGIPLIQTRRVPIKMLVEQLEPTSSDKKIIESHIASIKLVSVLDERTIKIRPFRSKDYSYQSIYVFYIELRKDDSLVSLSSLIHSAFPEPTMLIYERTNKNYISLAYKRINKNDNNRSVVEETYVSIVPKDIKEEEITLRAVSGTDLKDYYSNLIKWLYRIKVLSITNIYPQKDSDFKTIIEKYERLKSRLNSLNEEYKKTSMLAEMMRIDEETYDIEHQLENIVRELKGEQ